MTSVVMRHTKPSVVSSGNRAESMPFVPKTKNQKPKTNLPGGRLKVIVARRKADLKGEV